MNRLLAKTNQLDTLKSWRSESDGGECEAMRHAWQEGDATPGDEWEVKVYGTEPIQGCNS